MTLSQIKTTINSLWYFDVLCQSIRQILNHSMVSSMICKIAATCVFANLMSCMWIVSCIYFSYVSVRSCDVGIVQCWLLYVQCWLLYVHFFVNTTYKSLLLTKSILLCRVVLYSMYILYSTVNSFKIKTNTEQIEHLGWACNLFVVYHSKPHERT